MLRIVTLYIRYTSHMLPIVIILSWASKPKLCKIRYIPGTVISGYLSILGRTSDRDVVAVGLIT
jgi:hypothetical protein